MRCPSCNKFCGLEMQDPEVNDLSMDLDSMNVTAEVRIVRNSECCSDECKEYNFSAEAEIPDEIQQKIAEHPDDDYDVEEGSVEQLEEGGHRYKKSYYGFVLNAEIVRSVPAVRQRTPEEDAELDKLRTDYATTNASDKLRARRAELMLIGQPTKEVLGTVELTDKIEASGMDELN